MKIFLVAVAMILTTFGGQAAADPAVYDWSGLYFGGHAGGIWGNRSINTQNPPPNFGLLGDFGANSKVRGALAGGQIGLNYQSGNIVFGIQADVAWTNASSDTGGDYPIGNAIASCSLPAVGAAILRCAEKTDWLASATVRGGYAWNNALLYVKGGGAWTEEHYKFGRNNVAPVIVFPLWEGSDTRSGWTVGAGFEYAFAPNWTAFAEYNYYDFGSYREFLVPQGILAGAQIQDLDYQTHFHAAKVGINYKFNWNGSVLAKR